MKRNITLKFRLIFLLMLAVIPLARAQNSCAEALAVTAGTYVIPGINGTNIATTCSNTSAAEWYVYTPTENHNVTVTSDFAINTCGDTNFSVYSGTCGALTCLDSDDDSGIIQCNGGSSFLSVLTFEAMAGQSYYIAWDNRWNANGFTFEIIEAPYTPSPCTTAEVVTAGLHTVSAVDGGNKLTTCSTQSFARWYSYTPTDDFHLTITSDLEQNLCRNTNLMVYTGSCSGTLACVASNDDGGVLECPADQSSLLSRLTFDVAQGVTYYIVWDAKWEQTGFDFEIQEEEIIVPVEYDNQVIGTLTGYSLCVTDMNGDGFDDLASVSSGNLRLHLQGEAGALAVSNISVPGGTVMPTWSLAAADYNRDGFTDILIGNGGGVSFWTSGNAGTTYSAYTPGQYIFCQRTNFVDINNDGNLDAFSCHDIAPNCYYMYDGTTTLAYNQSSGTSLFGNIGGNYASIWSDFNNDGAIDLFVSKCSGPPCELHRNNGDGTWTDVAYVSGLNFQPVQSWSSAVADFDNDGDMDILVGTNGSGNSRLFRNDLDLGITDGFTNITLESGWDTNSSPSRDYVAYDFDNNGFVDVLSGSGRIMFNQGDLTFQPTYYPGIAIGPVGDLNADGFLDILTDNTVHYGQPNDNNWLRVSLKGLESNAQGIGARVEIHGDFGVQIRDIRSGEGFEYMGTTNAHFGLGQATAIESLVIRWPSGTVDEFPNPEINQNLQIVEGSAPLSTADASQDGLRIYPNPTRDMIRISLAAHNGEVREVAVLDMAGRQVLAPEWNQSGISLQSLARGTYLLVVETQDGKLLSHKVIRE